MIMIINSKISFKMKYDIWPCASLALTFPCHIFHIACSKALYFNLDIKLSLAAPFIVTGIIELSAVYPVSTKSLQ